MRRLELASSRDCSNGVEWRLAAGPPEGELGAIWISAGGGGLGSRGELGARAMAVVLGATWCDGGDLFWCLVAA